MGQTLGLGRYGEDLAARYLEAAGMQILAQNWTCEHGELDLVAREGRTLVVCEVKTRRSLVAGHPVEAVTPEKVARLRRLTGLWLRGSPERFAAIRIDVVAIVAATGTEPVVRHLRAVS